MKLHTLTAEDRLEAERMREQMNYFIEGRAELNRVVEDEYPEV